jgi:UDP-2-acetamido-3-amino-2,3-dideoxy-glucuronate N-acetyltransferase
MRSLIIGNGEIGSALAKILEAKYPKKVFVYDSARPSEENLQCKPYYLHICIPYCDNFEKIVADYVDIVQPATVIVHSSVKPGICERIAFVCLGRLPILYSPVRGKHPEMIEGLKTYQKYLYFDNRGYDEAMTAARYFQEAGIPCKTFPDTITGETAKLLALCRYGVYIAFAKEQERLCEKLGIKYWQTVVDWEKTRNEGLRTITKDGLNLSQPELYPFQDYIGGHCCVEDMELLLNYLADNPKLFGNFTMPILEAAYETGRNTKIWQPCKVYDTAIIGKGCNIGVNCEIGHNVKIGNGVRIGHGCFIPEGVTIEDGCFIAPGVFFSNDKHPPSHDKSQWGKILIKKGAIIGMRATILPGVVVGEGAMVGAGSVLTKDVPAGEKWYGNPAMPHGKYKGAMNE